MRPSVLIAAIGLACSTRAMAQQTTLPSLGARLRFTYLPLEREAPTALPKPAVAAFAGLRSDTVFAIDAATGDTMAYALRAIRRVEVSTATYHPTLRTAAIGAAVGGVTFAIVGMLRPGTRHLHCGFYCEYDDARAGLPGAVKWGSIGAALGFVSGFAIGTQLSADRWAAIDLFGRTR